MLTLELPAQELYDPRKREFLTTEPVTLSMEHSLLSITKWESKWKKPFLKSASKLKREEFLDYARCMTINRNVDAKVFLGLRKEDADAIVAYIDDPMTATWFREEKNGKTSGRVITNELIYYWMTVYSIPFECEKWHLNRLMTLIRVCDAESAPKKKMSKRQTAQQYKALNDARRKASGSRG